MSARRSRLPWISALLAAAALVVAAVPGAGAAIEFLPRGPGVLSIPRLLACHWAHWSTDHLAWDLCAFLALGALAERRDRARFLGCLFVSALVVAPLGCVAQPDVRAYRGLSGLDSALFGLCAATLLRDGLRAGDRLVAGGALLALLGFAAKVGWEALTGTTAFADCASAGMVPVPGAHVAGIAVGIEMGLSSSLALFRRVGRASAG